MNNSTPAHFPSLKKPTTLNILYYFEENLMRKYISESERTVPIKKYGVSSTFLISL